jgi:hypothetical protein
VIERARTSILKKGVCKLISVHDGRGRDSGRNQQTHILIHSYRCVESMSSVFEPVTLIYRVFRMGIAIDDSKLCKTKLFLNWKECLLGVWEGS